MNTSSCVQAFVSSVLSATAFSTLYLGIPTLSLLPSVASAATCYIDDRGRIVTRRRPGYTAIECPSSEPSPITPSTTPAPTNDPDTLAAPTSDAPPAIDQSVEQPAAPSVQLYRLPGRRGALEPAENPGQPKQRAQRLRNPASPIPRPSLSDYGASVPTPDRWRIVDDLGYTESLLDPYNRNPLKGDKPIGDEWFYNVAVIADTILELRDIPTPVGSSSTQNTGEIDVFGDQEQTLAVQNVAVELVYYKGDTVFRPPDHEFRLTAAFNYNYAVLEEIQGINADPRDGDDRTDSQVGIQAAFYDKHLRNVSDRYDFDSLRIGIQPFNNDFRGFLFQDNQFGIRLFGIRDNNKWQYNLAWFRRIEKDTNSGLNDLGRGLRDDDVFVANLYRQDMPVKGFNSQASILYNRNTEGDEFHYNENDFIERPASLGFEAPRDYDVVYLGYSGDGHFGRLNLTTSNYYAFGQESRGVFVNDEVDISAFFHASEISMDFDWFRPRISFMYASGDSDPYDDVATGFDAVFENPVFAGSDTSYWNRQAVPLIGGGRVAISGRNSLLNALRSSKEEGQSNFTNPGLILFGLGADMDLTPALRLSLSLNSLFFDKTEVLEVARNQPDIDKDIGLDASVSLTYRPFTSQNIVLRGSYATLIPGAGFDDLYPDETAGYFFFNATLTY
ncbi:hypothetical protein [Granulosicoccus antarcticus]|nr:hypothetical protein [Granulosicoccus antarcticus]